MYQIFQVWHPPGSTWGEAKDGRLKDKDVSMDDRYRNQIVLGRRWPRTTAIGLTVAFLTVIGCTTAAFAGAAF